MKNFDTHISYLAKPLFKCGGGAEMYFQVYKILESLPGTDLILKNFYWIYSGTKENLRRKK